MLEEDSNMVNYPKLEEVIVKAIEKTQKERETEILKKTWSKSKTIQSTTGQYQNLLTITEPGENIFMLFVLFHADQKITLVTDDEKLEFPSFSGLTLCGSSLNTWGYTAEIPGLQLIKNVAGLVVIQVTLPIRWNRKLDVWIDNNTGTTDLVQLTVTYQRR